MDDVTAWLLRGDPALRYQVKRYLLNDIDGAAIEQRSIELEGWGADLLAHRDVDGGWAGALYSPKWTSTTYTLLELADLGLAPCHPAAIPGVEKLVAQAMVFDGGGLSFARTVRTPEVCITAMLVKLAAWAGVSDPRIDDAFEWLLGCQTSDGGWNCLYRESDHGSFNTTITVLEAFAQPGVGTPPSVVVDRANEFFLVHRLYKSHRTGEVADTSFTRFSFPPRWHFDVLRGLVHFASIGFERDPRFDDAVALVTSRQRVDGRWPVGPRHPGRVWHVMERGPGPGRWNTLRALRVLRWWGDSSA